MRNIVRSALVVVGFALAAFGLFFAAADHVTHIQILTALFGYWTAASIHESTHGVHILIGIVLFVLGAGIAVLGVSSTRAQRLNTPRTARNAKGTKV
jgi:hypothetical protein